MHRPSEFWDAQVLTRQRHNEGWLAHLPVRLYVNEAISRRTPSLWPMDWLRDVRGTSTWSRGLSIGCGNGGLERELIRKSLCSRVDAFDGSMVSLSVAAASAAAEGMGSDIHYFAADFNAAQLPPRTYDVVFCQQSLHHVAALEHLLSQIRRTLRRNGFLYFDEYIGPSRDAWTDAHLAAQRAVYAAIPREWRLYDEVAFPIETGDPSEGVRADEIMASVMVGFDIVERRDYGGSLLAVLVPLIDWSVAPETLLVELIEEEKRMREAGAPSYYTIVLARPKRWLDGLKAKRRYRELALDPRVVRLTDLATGWDVQAPRHM